MRKISKLIIIIIMLLGITLSILNFISVDNMAQIDTGTNPKESTGTWDPGDKTCTGPPLNC